LTEGKLALVIGSISLAIIIAMAVFLPSLDKHGSSATDVSTDQPAFPIIPTSTSCTYLIYQGLPKATNNYTTYAKNCLSNFVVSASYNASKVFNDVATLCNTNKGCYVHVSGYSNDNAFRAYNITTHILIPESGHFNLYGDGTEFTVLKIPSTFDNNMFEYSGNHTGKRSFFNRFSDFQMWGNDGSGGVNNRGFYVNTTSGDMVDSLWYNLFLRNFKQDDFYFGSLVPGVNNCWNNKIDVSTIELAGNAGVFITGGINCQDIKITNTKFLFNSQYGLFTDGYFGLYAEGWYYNNHRYAIKNNGGVGNIFTQNRFYENGDNTANTYYDLWNIGSDNVINANNFEGSDMTNKPKYALFQDTFTHRNVIVGNHVSTVSRTYATATIFVASTQQDNNNIENNVGANPFGKVSLPFWTTQNTIIPTSGNSATPTNNTDTTNANTGLYMTVSGGTGVSITLKDNLGNTIQSGLATITQQDIPFNYKINVRWVTVPTFTVWFR